MNNAKVASIINGVMAWSMQRLSKRDKTAHHRTFHLVLAVVLAFSLLMPASASANTQIQPKASIDPQVLEQYKAQDEITFWVIMREKADLKAAYSINNWEARGQFVYQKLQAVANHSQAEIRSNLKKKGKEHQPFWIINTIQVTADKATMQELAARPDVESIVPDGGLQIPPTEPGKPESSVNGIEWNIDRIRAPEVWSTFGARGEGIVIANIDTGVQFDHPALVAQYRGNLGGSFDHNYNWYDPSQVCGSPSLVPCDNYGHGTHTMGTMVGDDGNPGVNQIGVAPGARWIAAKGCESNWCSDSALLASAQWILAPTDLNGQNPRPDLRPNIVNNSWGGGGGQPWFQGMVQAWVASGIFPAFSNGNAGPSCGTSGSPGDYPESYSAGAFDYWNNIAWFSSRGPSAFGGTKPNLSAPGVDVRSSIPGNSYEYFSGTSMASPHVAGAVALMWSAAPSLLGDIASTRALLDQTAIDTIDWQCEDGGGYPPPGEDGDPNNVYGEGRLDVFAAVDLSPRGPQGSLQGTITDASSNQPLSDVLVQAAGPSNRTTYSDANGFYSFPTLSIGTYDVNASIFGYFTQETTVDITEDATTTQDFALQPAPSHAVSGTVFNQNGDPVTGVMVTILETPIPSVITDANGFYSFASVPEGTYDVYASAGACNDPQSQQLVVDSDKTLNFTLAQHFDAYGYSCEMAPFNFIEASNDIGLYGDDSSIFINLPFPFTFYGQSFNSAYITTNGFLSFLGNWVPTGGGPIPDYSPPNAAIYPFWDDLYVGWENASIRTELLGTEPNRQFVIEWQNVTFCCSSGNGMSLEVILNEDGGILTQYTNIDENDRGKGAWATVGIENETSTTALQYSYHQPAIMNNMAVRYIPPPMGFVAGQVTDGATNQPISGAVVWITETGASLTTDAEGRYRILLPTGNYTFNTTVFGYESKAALVTVVKDSTTTQNFPLTPLPKYIVSGHVKDGGGNPLANTTITVQGTPLSAVLTDANGYYTIPNVPQGEYDFQALMGRCTDAQDQYAMVNTDLTLDFTLNVREDAFGYHCQLISSEWVEATNVLSLTGTGNSLSVSLPFKFPLYGQEYQKAYVSTSGFLNFLDNNYAFFNDYIPSTSLPNAAIYPFWDELYVLGGDSVIKTATVGTAPNRVWVLEYENVAMYYEINTRLNFEVKLYEGSGRIETLYQSMPGAGNGVGATIGIENADGTDAFRYSYYEEGVISDGLAIQYIPPRFGFVEGHVKDATDGTPLEGVHVSALKVGKTISTDVNGYYKMLLREGAYTLEASLTGYTTQATPINILDQQTLTKEFALKSPRAKVSPSAFEFIVPAGQTRTRTLTLTNIGQADLTYKIGEMNIPTVLTAEALPLDTDSHTASATYQPKSVNAVTSGGPVLVFMDAYPWSSNALFQVLNTNGIQYDVANSSQMDSVDMSQYEAVFISSDQPYNFYSNYAASFNKFQDYVQNGGFLWVGAAAWGWNGGDFTGGLLPGGATVGGYLSETYNDVLDPAHPVMQGVQSPFYGFSASHTYFENLPLWTNVITKGQSSGLPTMIEYDYGSGRVLAMAQTLEIGFYYWQDIKRILENSVPYAYSFEPFVDIPWLSESIVTGTLTPGSAQTVQVSVNTAGLTPGIYRARLVIVTNDPRNPRMQIPVTLIVPSYMQGVNAGGSTYIDLSGDTWATDQMYKSGSWGYVNKSTVVTAKKAISGTDDDKLYQSQRQNILEYRFDGLAPGVYQVDLRFAELKSAPPDTRRFDIMIEGNMVLTAHDIALEVGSYAADNHTFYVIVTDGTLNIRFISYRSYGAPVINAVRVTQRPDR